MFDERLSIMEAEEKYPNNWIVYRDAEVDVEDDLIVADIEIVDSSEEGYLLLNTLGLNKNCGVTFGMDVVLKADDFILGGVDR